MFFKGFPWNKDKTKLKAKINPAPLAKRFGSKFSLLMDRRPAACSGGRPVLAETEANLSASRIEDVRVVQPCIEAVTIAEDIQFLSVSYDPVELIPGVVFLEALPSAPCSLSEDSDAIMSPVPELSLTSIAEPSVDEPFIGLTSAFADSISDIDSDSDVPPLGDPTTDDYIFQCVLGDGSEGIVFLALGRRDRKPYAVKVVPKDVLPEGQYGNLFMSQYAMKAMKGSPFIIDLQAAFETTEHFIFVFPFYANGDLKEEMHDVGRYSEAETRTRIAQLVVALQELHSNRIMHRDLKPENILLNALGDFVLTDFGLCHTFGRPVEEQPWRVAGMPDWELAEDFDPEGHHEAGGGDKTKFFCGTPNYIAPEVYGEGSDGWYSYPADVWSLGIILYEMLHGKLPFGLSHEQVDEFDPMTCILYADLVVDEYLSNDARDLLCKLLEKNPDRRPGWETVKNHPWFNEIDWESVVPKEPPPAPLMMTLENLPPVPEEIRNIQFGEPCSVESAPYPYFRYTSPDHLQLSHSTTSLYTGSPDWRPTPSVLEGFGWPVASPGNAFAMCPRLSSAPNLQKTREVPSFRVLHTPFYGSIGWDEDNADKDDKDDDSSMCSALAQNMRAGAVPGLDVYPSEREPASCPFSRQSSFTVPIMDRSSSSQFADDTLAHSTHTEESPKGKGKDFLGDTGTAHVFQTSSSTNTHSDVLAGATRRRPFALAALPTSSPDSPIRKPAPMQDFLAPITSTPLKITRTVPERPSAPATPVKESESLALSDIIQFAEIPSFCLSTAECLSGSSVALPMGPADTSTLSRTMVASTLSGDGAYKASPGCKSLVMSDVNVGYSSQASAAGDTSTHSSGTSSLSPLKPWTRKVVGLVKGWLKPAQRREWRRGLVAN